MRRTACQCDTEVALVLPSTLVAYLRALGSDYPVVENLAYFCDAEAYRRYKSPISSGTYQRTHGGVALVDDPDAAAVGAPLMPASLGVIWDVWQSRRGAPLPLRVLAIPFGEAVGLSDASAPDPAPDDVTAKVLGALRKRVDDREAQHARCVPDAKHGVAVKYAEALSALQDVEKALGLPVTSGRVLGR